MTTTGSMTTRKVDVAGRLIGNPMQKPLPMHQSLRCSAQSKRTGLPCRSPAVKGWTVCRMHGARGGAPDGKRNGAYRHGGFTKEAVTRKQAVGLLMRLTGKTLNELA